ncbi:tRNA lysidine(34) synthetase TilS [Brevundimonas sp.]|uniref:tRNA lysidine(34) synthetase TilS n=1 Tax=Brevundimonas sp. TaxID=1871086 RepID=UPI0025DD75BD|nr:tRNA lysidine(34) synthetase TilS [Brevundimonas sp.]
MGPIFAQLDQRLSRHDARPVALALSGGGDSLALLLIAADWARANGRRLLALTVDHRLSPESPGWTAFAEEAARRMRADWRGLTWIGSKPTRGRPAAARQARHRLLAEAARKAGAHVLLMAHTADDVAENAWMRTQGSTLGRLTAWSPSPVWPEGRGLMILRPLLGERREALRDLLRDRDQRWIEDPANADPDQLRARARRALAGRISTPAPPQPEPPPLDAVVDLLAGSARLPAGSPWLAHAIACVSGRADLPRRDRVEAARARLCAEERATLGGVDLRAEGDGLTLTREPGRSPPSSMRLQPGETRVWDGRFEVSAKEGGWTIAPSRGHAVRLAPTDRVRLRALPTAARPALPVLFREGDASPVLASPAVSLRCLVGDRLRLASGGARTEADLISPDMAN